MRTLRLAALAAALTVLAAPAAASAGPTIAVSAGAGWQTSPSERMPTNVMLAPGYQVSFVRAELGLVTALADARNPASGRYATELEVRPMLVVAPPMVPVYGRAIFAVTNLLDGPRDLAYGGALGVRFGLLGAELFAEAGVLPRNVTVPAAGGGTEEERRWVTEGRLGLAYAF